MDERDAVDHHGGVGSIGLRPPVSDDGAFSFQAVSILSADADDAEDGDRGVDA